MQSLGLDVKVGYSGPTDENAETAATLASV
jgi:hypothetical protein